MFLDPSFLHDVGIPAICKHLRQKLAYLCLRDLLVQNGGFGGQNKGMGGAILTPNELVLTFGFVTSVPLLAINDQAVQP